MFSCEVRNATKCDLFGFVFFRGCSTTVFWIILDSTVSYNNLSVK